MTGDPTAFLSSETKQKLEVAMDIINAIVREALFFDWCVDREMSRDYLRRTLPENYSLNILMWISRCTIH